MYVHNDLNVLLLISSHKYQQSKYVARRVPFL